jgi:hypothetical protein
VHGYTTVMNWTSYNDIEYRGQVYGQKDAEFLRFIDLPAAVPDTTFELALNDGKTRRSPKSWLRHKGWHVLDPAQVCPDPDSYRTFVAGSRAEWSVAKSGYVTAHIGWFSERSACYLAAGRPVVVQSTGCERFLPHGEGLLSFTDFDGARRAIRSVEEDYHAHSQAARAIAEAEFDSAKVLSRLLDTCLTSAPRRRPPSSCS